MQVTNNFFSKNRYDIEGISEKIDKKTGVKGYHGCFGRIIGWIAAKILHKAVPFKTSKGTIYLNCKSLEHWFKRVSPDLGLDKDFSKKMHDPEAVGKMIELLKKPKSPDELWTSLDSKTKLLKINYLKHNENHRFPDVLCPINTAIMVDGCSLHANKVSDGKFHFVASQAPYSPNESLFWKWHFQNDYSIMDLTTFFDKGVSPYYPENLNETFQAGPYLIKLIDKEGIRRKYEVSLYKETKEITRFHYADWQDFGDGSLKILEQLVEVIEKNPKMWVHCRAGIGRTGTLITSALLKEKIQNGEITKANYGDSLVNLILSLREKRGEGFVQTEGQFKMLHQYGMSLLGA